MIWTILFFGCNAHRVRHPAFVARGAAATGLHFTNKLTATPQFNMFHYMYFYNGAGIGAGDFNNDGKVDLFFAANQGDNKLYMNRGNLKFEEVTAKAKIIQDKGWSTGVSVVDINSDGLLDIYVCKVGKYLGLQSRNQLFVCERISDEGIPVYKEEAASYGIDFSGFTTQAAFLDYDMDNDLDLFLLNHSVHQNGSFAARENFKGTYHALSGDRMYRNDGRKFTDVTRTSGINSTAISYGLGIAVSDINLDGYPDLYIGNDFHENDYLYLNQRDGSFKDVATEQLMHTSQFSMGVDVADINNDAHPEIISVDMLPSDPYILKRSLGDDEYNIFNLKLSYGYNHQYTRNNLQLNRMTGLFSEVALYAGVAATDWSWAPLWMDFDNDGWKDLFVSNGIPKRLNDIDYVNHVSNEEVQQKIQDNKLEEGDMALISKFPQIKLPNKFFRNKGNVVFEDLKDSIENNLPTFSNGSAYADLDNDGDLDIVVNNIDDPVMVYENQQNNKKTRANNFLSLHLKGPQGNARALGAKVIVFSSDQIHTYEKFPVHGFQSSMELPLHIGMEGVAVDSVVLVWPDNTTERLQPDSTVLFARHKKGLPVFNYKSLHEKGWRQSLLLKDITAATGLLYQHEENNFVEFDREPLMPFMVSREGPGLAIGDANGDGLDDVFIGSAKGKKSAVFLQTPSGTFARSIQPQLDNDSTYEDVDAVWVDVNNDKSIDLVVASGGNEYYGSDRHMSPRVYRNNGKGILEKQEGAFRNIYLTGGAIAAADFNGDGFTDLFAGARAKPWEYGVVPQSYLLLNDGSGNFSDVTKQYSAAMSAIGLVMDARWLDLDTDGDPDLVLALEWDGICVFRNNKGSFSKQYLTKKKGWWNFVLPVDVDADGDLDIIAGNQGWNSRFRPTEEKPARLYVNDFDGNGKIEQVLTWYLQDKEIPFATKDDLQKQMPVLKKRFLYAADMAQASLEEIFSADKLEQAAQLQADHFSNSVLINDGKMNFTLHPLPWQAQLTTYRDAVVVDANNDRLPDILMGGNFYENSIQLGRLDGDFGTCLVNNGGGRFTVASLQSRALHGQVRRIGAIKINGENGFVLAKNNDSLSLIILSPATKPQVVQRSRY